MKLTSIFSGLVAALAFTSTSVALPIAESGAATITTTTSPNNALRISTLHDRDFTTRANTAKPETTLPVKTEEDKYYEALSKLHSPYESGKWYAFLDTTPRGEAAKMDDDAEHVRDNLGYDHVKLILGQYMETRKETGPPKKRTGVTITKKWINISFYDLIVNKETEKTEQRTFTWDPAKAKKVSYKGQANKGSQSAASAAGKKFAAENPTWGQCASANCGGYVDAVWAAVK